LKKSIGRSHDARNREGENEPAALPFQGIRDQHCGYGKKAKPGKSVHTGKYQAAVSLRKQFDLGAGSGGVFSSKREIIFFSQLNFDTLTSKVFPQAIFSG
jgi:hypothetical protein